MSELVLHGSPRSNYVRTCRIVLAEKGVEYTYDPIMPQSPEQLARHPWGKVPAMTHGALALYETLAITRYIDGAFDGPALQPAAVEGRARMDQWLSVYNAYLNPILGSAIAIERMLRKPPNEEKIAAAIPDAVKCLDVLEEGLSGSAFLVDDEVTLADFFLVPTLHYLMQTPEAETLLGETGFTNAWLTRMTGLKSVNSVLGA